MDFVLLFSVCSFVLCKFKVWVLNVCMCVCVCVFCFPRLVIVDAIVVVQGIVVRAPFAPFERFSPSGFLNLFCGQLLDTLC